MRKSGEARQKSRFTSIGSPARNAPIRNNTRREAYVMDRRRALQLALAVLLLALTSGGAGAADQKMVFKASDVHPEGYPTVQAVENMGKKLEAATGGRL